MRDGGNAAALLAVPGAASTASEKRAAIAIGAVQCRGRTWHELSQALCLVQINHEAFAYRGIVCNYRLAASEHGMNKFQSARVRR